MKTSNPLAAVLLLLASSASAQFSAAAGTGLSLTGNAPAPFSLAAKATPVNDFTFKCGTPPWDKCTDVEMNQRQSILISRTCPEPVSNACSSWLMANIDTNATQLLGTRPDVKWADPEKCNFIPCRTATSPAGQTLAGRSYEDEPGFIGPPSPFRNQGPQPFADASSFKQAMQEQESLTPGKVVDLGNNTYAVDTGDGKYSIGGLCSGAPCNGLPKPAEQIPGLTDALQAANSLNSGGKSLNNDNPNGFTASGNKQTPNLENAGRTNGGEQQPASNDPSEDPRSMGLQAAADSFALSGDSRSSGSGSSVASNGIPSSGGATAEQVLKMKGASLGSIAITYTDLQKLEKNIEGAAGAYSNGKMDGFASPNAPSASGRLAEPPVDEKYLGKIQASSNE